MYSHDRDDISNSNIIARLLGFATRTPDYSRCYSMNISNKQCLGYNASVQYICNMLRMSYTSTGIGYMQKVVIIQELENRSYLIAISK